MGKPLKIMLSMCRRHPDSQHPDNKRAIENLKDRGFPIRWDHEIFGEFTDGMSLLPWARSLNVAACLAQGADYIFILDDDVWFRREDIADAINSGLPIVGLPVMLKTQNLRSRTMNYSTLDGEPFIDVDKDFRQIKSIGTGAMVVKAEVFRALQKTRPYFLADGFQSFRPHLPIQENCFDYFPTGVQDIDGKPRYIGEDYGFCFSAMSVGYPTFCHNGSMTAHMISGVPNGYLCDMIQMRKWVREGTLVQGEAFNL